MSTDLNPFAMSTELAPSRWGALGHVAFTTLWVTSIFLNIGTAMFDTASAWLMTSLYADPMAVGMVKALTSLPMFLLGLPAGALADIIDPRRLLIVVAIAATVVSIIFAALVSFGLAAPSSLLLTTFLLGAGGALSAPARLSITPLLVPRRDLAGAVAADSVGFNLSRAVGPALGGIAIVGFGISTPFWIFGACNLGIIAALLWWRSPPKSADSVPAERLVSAFRTGLRYAANSRHLRAILVRTLAFFSFASAYWALLPLVARSQMAQGPECYGILLSSIGAGAIGGSLALNWLRVRIGPDRTVALGTIATAFALVLFGLAREPVIAICASAIAGASWALVLAALYVSAQFELPDWVRARGLAIFLTASFGAITVGSVVWGYIASMEGLSIAHFMAAAGAMLCIPITWRWKLHTSVELGLPPSTHRYAPAVAYGVKTRLS